MFVTIFAEVQRATDGGCISGMGCSRRGQLEKRRWMMSGKRPDSCEEGLEL